MLSIISSHLPSPLSGPFNSFLGGGGGGGGGEANKLTTSWVRGYEDTPG